MTIGFVLVGADGTPVKVTPSGELAVAPVRYSKPKFNELAVAGQAYNFFIPKPTRQFIITSIWFRADKQVSSTVDATVVIYEAADAETDEVDEVLHQYAVVQGDIVDQSPLRTEVSAGKWVNAKTTDADVHMNISGYYIKELREAA